MPLTPRQEAARLAQLYLQARPVYLDTETTGTDERSEIVEISIIDHDGQVLLDSLVRPQSPIPYGAARIHHITDAMVAQAPTWAELWPQVADALRGRQIGIYNREFDLRLMQQSHRLHRLAWNPSEFRAFCIMKLYAQYVGQRGSYGDFKWHRLEVAGRNCGISLPNSHRAKDDTLLARAVLEYMAAH